MNVTEYERMYRVEDTYWWFVARRQMVLSLLSDCSLQKNSNVLDVGCGTGAMLAKLSPYGKVYGADFSQEALSFCRERFSENASSCCLTRADACELPFADDSFECVTALDIIEHIDDDQRALHEIQRVMSPGGVLIVTTPAFMFLWSEHDEALHHYRRYTSQQLATLAVQAGLVVERISYSITTLFPLIWMYRLIRRVSSAREPEAHLQPVAPWLNSVLTAICGWETRWIRKNSMPFGVSIVLVARKPIGETEERKELWQLASSR